MPQLGLQQTNPTLHVIMPQLSLTGIVTGSRQEAGTHGSRGRTQRPQTGSQHTSFTLQVTSPQLGLSTM
jgi:hypothetical protein